MNFFRKATWVVLCLAWEITSVSAASKYTMPDIDQDENTCFPAACSNLIYWFGQNGYPKLLPTGEDAKARQRQIIARVLVHCQATFKVGTDFDTMVPGLNALFKASGYEATITYRGQPKTLIDDLSWFDNNSRDNTGFILCFAYAGKKTGNVYSDFAGHAVTLLRYDKAAAVILDPAHAPGDRGRRIVKFQRMENLPISTDKGTTVIPIAYEAQGMPLTDTPFCLAILVGAICIELPPPAVLSESMPIGQKP